MRTVDIPGGTANLIDTIDEFTPRRRRPIEKVASRLDGGKLLAAMMTATRLLVDGDLVQDNSDKLNEDGKPVYPGGDVNLTDGQYELVLRMADVTILGMLHSWTLPIPVPRTEDDVLDLPPDVYETLRVETARVNAEIAADREMSGFTVDSVEHRASPTGGFVDMAKPSAAATGPASI